MKKALADIALRHAARFRKQLAVYRAHPTIGEMHTLRIDMKAIRSLCFLLEAAGEKKEARILHREVKKLFGKAGRIRELQLQAAWLRHNHLPALYRLQHFPTQLAAAHGAFLRSGQRREKFIHALGRRLAKGMHKSHPRKARAYVISLIDDVCHSLHPGTPPSQWHALRKKIKRMLHACRWLSLPHKAPELIRAFIQDMDDLQALLGKWHDMEVMMQVLQTWKQGPDHTPDLGTALLKAKRLGKREREQAARAVVQKLTELHRRWARST